LILLKKHDILLNVEKTHKGSANGSAVRSMSVLNFMEVKTKRRN